VRIPVAPGATPQAADRQPSRHVTRLRFTVDFSYDGVRLYPMSKTVVVDNGRTRTETRTSAFNIIGSCRKCGRTSRAVATRIVSYTSLLNRLPHRSVREVWPAAVECCGLPLSRTPIKGVRNDTTCDHRCTEAKGHKCECSCGGKNHGASHDA